MAASPIAKLSKAEQRHLLHGLDDLNTVELKSFCRRHEIPYAITVETRDGSRRATRNHDRKGVMLNRLRHFLRTGSVLDEALLQAVREHTSPNPERAFLSDRASTGNIPGWKAARASRAKKVIELLQRVSVHSRTATSSAQTGYRASR